MDLMICRPNGSAHLGCNIIGGVESKHPILRKMVPAFVVVIKIAELAVLPNNLRSVSKKVQWCRMKIKWLMTENKVTEWK